MSIMVRTPSEMIPLGTKAPEFNLLSPKDGSFYSLAQLRSERATVVIFICNHCPYVVHLIKQMVEVAKCYGAKGVQFIAINSNDVEQYPQDGPAEMVEFAQQNQLDFPYLFDETQDIARAYHAACTPDLFVFDKHLSLRYRGQFDDSRPSSDNPVTGLDLRNALDCMLSDKDISFEQKPSVGCNIKWKA